jgi:predicted Rdx family selenoprotein
MLALITALVGFLAALAPPLAEYMQKRLRSTPADDAAAARAGEIALLPGRIAELDAAGDFASADVLRRRLRDLTAPERGGDAAG